MAEADHTSVYLYFDKDGILIYVGITGRGIQRQREHERDKPWWSLTKTQTIEHYETRQEALRRESELIAIHSPPFNTQHNPDLSVRDVYMRYQEANGEAEPEGKRIPLVVKAKLSDSIIAVTDMRYAKHAKDVQAGGDFTVAAAGQRARGIDVRKLGSAIVVRLMVAKPEQIKAGTVMYRVNPHGMDIKRIDFT